MKLKPKSKNANNKTEKDANDKQYRIFFFGILLFVLVIFVVLTFITRDTLFLKYFNKDKLPFAILSVSFISLPVLKMFSSYLKQYSLRVVAITASGIISVAYFLFFNIILVLGSSTEVESESSKHVKYVAGAFYVCSEIIVGIMLQLFWESVSSSFLLSDKKVSVNSINYGSTFASLFIGFGFIKKLNEWNISTVQNLLILSVIAIFITLGYFVSPSPMDTKSEKGKAGSSKGSGAASTSASKHGQASTSSSFKIIMSKPYYIHMCVFEVAATIGRVLCDIQMLAILSQLPESEMKSKLGYINGFQSLLMIPLQASTSYINRRFGVLYGLAFMPISLMLFGFFTAVTPSINMLVSTRSIYNAVTYTIFGTSRELLWLPLSVEDRLKAKPIITGSFRSLARAGAAFLSMFLKYVQKYQADVAAAQPGLASPGGTSDAKIIGICIVVLGIGFLMEVFRARIAYAKEFYNMIGTLDGAIRSDGDNLRADVHHLNMADPVSKKIIRETLMNGKISQRIFILDSLPPNVIVDFGKELRALIWVELNNVRETKGLQYKHSHKRMSSMDLYQTRSRQKLEKCDSGMDLSAGNDTHFYPDNESSNQGNLSTPHKIRRSSTSMSPRMSSAKKSVRRNARARGLSSTDSTDALNISFGSDTENLSIDTSPESTKKFYARNSSNGRGRPQRRNSQDETAPHTSIRLKALEVAGRAGLLTVDDLLMIICDTSLAREMRMAAIHICGNNEDLNAGSSTSLIRTLERLVNISSNPRTLRVSAAICLLKMTDWMHESSHIFLYSMMHNKSSDEKSQVAALTLIGMHLSEMISDGYLIFILNGENIQNNTHLLIAALKNCNGRRSKILLPSLVKKLAVSAVVDLVCEALLQYEFKDTVAALEKLLYKEYDNLRQRLKKKHQNKRLFKSESIFIGVARYLGHIFEQHEVQSTLRIAKMIIKYLNDLLDIKTVSKTFSGLLQHYMDNDLKVHLRAEMNSLVKKTIDHVDTHLDQFFKLVSAEEEQFSTTMLDANILARDKVHFLLQIVAISHFPRGLSIDLLVEAISSANEQVRVASFEVLENLLQGTIKDNVKSTLLKLLESESALERKLQGRLDESVLCICNGFSSENDVGTNRPITYSSNDEMLVKMQTLENSALFQGLRLRELRDVAENVSFEYISKGNYLAHEEVLHIVVKGKFSIKEGDNDIIAVEGQSIGDPPLRAFFSSYSSPTATPTNFEEHLPSILPATTILAEAAEDSLVIKITHASLQKLLKVNSRVLNGILRTLLINVRECNLLRKTKKTIDVPDEDMALHGILQRHVQNAQIKNQSLRFSSVANSLSNTSSLQKCIKLSRSRIFATLDHKYIEALAFIAVERVYAAGDIIFHEGDSADTLFIAEDEYISFDKQTSFHMNRNRDFCRQLYGEIALLPHATRLTSVYAARNCPGGKVTVLEFSARSLLSLTKRHRAICQALCLCVSERLEYELAQLRRVDRLQTSTGTPAESTMTNSDGQSKDLTSVLESSEEDNAFASNMFGGNGKHSDRDVFVHQMPKRRESSLSASGQWGRMRMSLHAVSGLRRRKRKGTHLM